MADNVEPDPPPPDDVAVTQPVTPIPPNAPPPRQGCMEKRSVLEKILVVILIIIIIICLGFVVAFLVYYFFATPPTGTCLTEQCVEAAARIKSYMDPSVNPCNNFYEYACGGWLKRQVLGPDDDKIDVGSVIGDVNRLKIRTLIEKETDSEELYKTQPKIFYKACMNEAKLKERGNGPFFKLVNEVGKYPSLDSSWNETDFDLKDMIVKLIKLGISPLISVMVDKDFKDSKKSIFYVKDASLSLGSGEMYKEGRNDSKIKHYEKWLVDNLVLLGADKSTAEADNKDVVDLEIQISKLMRKDIQKTTNYNESYNPFSIADLQTKYPWLDWLQFFQGVASTSGFYIGATEIIINTEPAYLEQLGPVIAKTSKRVLANYLLAKLLPFTRALGPDFVKLVDQFTKATKGTEPKPKWELCIEEATSVFAESVSTMYINEYFKNDAKEYMNSLIKDLTAAFKELLEENAWMAAETKKLAEDKLTKMRSKIGYPDYINDTNRLNSIYKQIPTKEDEYLETVIAYKKHIVSENIKKLRQAQEDKWPTSPTESNAYYDFVENQIIFPAGFLQPPIYSPDYSSSMNYGAIGMIVGHEITHGFDTTGRQYDLNGELKTWWKDSDTATFKSRTECFVNQYGCYKWDTLSIDGQKTLGENIADNGGLKQSYRAYRNFVRRRGSEEHRLPGLNMKHNQIFFLSFAQVWCAKVRDEAKKRFVQSDTHSPPPFRVFGTLENSEEFAEAFQCEKGSRMNPLRKCILW